MSVEKFVFEKLLENLSFEPTDCQSKLFGKLARFMTDSSSPDIFLINGYAGTGKTSSLASLVKVLKGFSRKYVLLAPTGRAAKVLSGYTGHKSLTIHKQIYRQKSVKDGVGYFTLDVNKNKETFFIVDEASLIQSGYGDSGIFGSGRLLDDLVEYVRSASGNKLILIGDSAQLPPVGEEISNALNLGFLKNYGDIESAVLTSVVRQAKDSGILFNATMIRQNIETSSKEYPNLILEGFKDVERITGSDLIEALSGAYDRYGMDQTLVLCRSNKRANRYNQGIRSSILYREERVNRGDKVMVVKNCYQFLEDVPDLDFIANGDVAEIVRIHDYQERYGLNFAQATLLFPDYNDVEIEAKVILNTLESETASLSMEEQKRLFTEVMEDYSHIKVKRKRIAAVREDRYYNALQIKHANAITCHKSQGGQWNAVFIDNPFWRGELSLDDLKWLYTAVTRATEKVYFVNFDKKFFKN
ncbi:MAG: AAA family ATPase [Bacteroidales bacterium]|jgi:exodeoxyribonuclease-5|nr:AAA family ATPase [Bacteroidales bacterium]MDD3299254.1 AAA family ATPase [Bacteroidales bacterium]MDD3843145.1 AAA family ATPase [Bacteroidales bacterium]MDD4617971.1 AAA family ATPase [Bacteroidales bacterium]